MVKFSQLSEINGMAGSISRCTKLMKQSGKSIAEYEDLQKQKMQATRRLIDLGVNPNA